MTPLEEFDTLLDRSDLREYIARSVIGDGVPIHGPDGAKPLVYADYVASGRALAPVEDFIRDRVLPYYANSHTEASFCGAYMTRLREEARARIARLTGAGEDCRVVFAGSGATAGINRIAGLLDVAGRVAAGQRVLVLIGPYEHHSNILPWRESGAEVVEIAEAPAGGPNQEELEARLRAAAGHDLVIGSFSAASNVTGIVSPVEEVTRLLKRHGALAIWDYAGGAPYLPLDMGQGAAAKDAIVWSAHKFPGGPGGSGVMVLRDTVVRRATPTAPGGGSVRFVSPWRHDYSADVAAREEAGTPDVIGDIRAALALMVKEAIGQEAIARQDRAARALALAVWGRNPRIEILGNAQAAEGLPIFSLRIRDGRGGYVNHQLFTRMLSDLHGIQARGGCACAGPYAHRLLGIDRAESEELFARIEGGDELAKPGWVRLNFSYLMDEEKIRFVLAAVDSLAAECERFAGRYEADPATARFFPRAGAFGDGTEAA